MKNKIKILIPLLFLLFAIPVFAAYVSGKITNVDITRIGDTVYLEGNTEGFSSKMRILIKVLDDKGTLQFFDEVPIEADGTFRDSFIPMNITEDTYLNINISGDLAYATKYYYSTEFANDEELIETSLLKQLQDYKYYKDDNSKYAMQFVFSYEHGIQNGNVIMTGTNFVKGDTLWSGKNDSVWASYLNTIRSLAANVTSKNITIYVYDKANTLLQTYPVIINNDNNDEATDPVIPDDIAQIIGTDISYTSNGNKISFTPSFMNNSTSRYLKLKFVGNFNKNDELWTNSSLVDLENFSRELSLKVKAKYNCDIDFYFYDVNNKILNSYSYYYYNSNKGETGTDSGNSGEEIGDGGIIITPVPDTPTPTPIPDSSNNDNSNITDDSPIYKVWSPYDDLGVYTLNLMLYSYNSATIDATLKSEGYEGSVYKYNYVLDDYTLVQNTINSLRNDSSKVIVVRGNTLGSNINFTVSSEIVDLLKANNVNLIFDTSYIKVEADFGTCNSSGEYKIVTNETIAMLTEKATDAYNVEITLGGSDVTNLFSHKVKLVLHYTNQSAASVADLRFVSTYYNNSTALNTTVNESLKAFISNYYGKGIYCSKSNTVIFNDSNFEDNTYRRYAEVVASKGIMDGGNSGVFNPKQTITRGEFVNYIARKMGANSSTNYFTDLSNAYAYFGAFNGAYELGILPPTWRGTSNVNNKITIEEMIYITVRCYEVNSLNSTAYGNAIYYKDAADISAWAKNKIAIASKIGLIPTDGYLYPTENGTKEDAAELIFKLLDAENLF